MRFETSWSGLGAAAPAWLRALECELRVVGGWLTREFPDELRRRRRRRGWRERLVVIAGEHQPEGGPARDADSGALLVHLVSRDEELLARFAERD